MAKSNPAASVLASALDSKGFEEYRRKLEAQKIATRQSDPITYTYSPSLSKTLSQPSPGSGDSWVGHITWQHPWLGGFTSLSANQTPAAPKQRTAPCARMFSGRQEQARQLQLLPPKLQECRVGIFRVLDDPGART